MNIPKICETCNTFMVLLYKSPEVISQFQSDTIEEALKNYKYLKIVLQLKLSSIFTNKKNNYFYKCACHDYINLNLYYHRYINTLFVEKLIEFKICPNHDKWDNDYEKIIIETFEPNRYYKHFYGMPICLKEAHIEKKHYDDLHYYYFEDVIAGHPKASHGWFQDSVRELVNLGIFLD